MADNIDNVPASGGGQPESMGSPSEIDKIFGNPDSNEDAHRICRHIIEIAGAVRDKTLMPLVRQPIKSSYCKNCQNKKSHGAE